MALSKQWDIGSSVFNLKDMALGLLRAATVDDVQPAAVLAAEALGSTLIVDPTLIGKAVDALGGGKSYRIENVKLQLGISSGGLASEVRKSTPLIRCFLLMSGLRLHLEAREIGELLYELLAQNGLLAITPVSPAQLTALTEALESNVAILLAQENVPVTYFTPLSEHLSSFSDTESAKNAFKPLYQDSAAELLCNAFLALRTEDVQRVDMSGLYSGVWISTLLCWLNPGNVDVFAETQELILGRGSGKIAVHLTHPDHCEGNADAWEIQQWSVAKDVTALIHLFSPGDYMKPGVDFDSRTLGDCRHNYQTGMPRSMFYGYVKVSCGFSEEAMHVIGQIAHGILWVAIDECGLRTVVEDSYPYLKIPLGHICASDLNRDPDAVLAPWGFPITAASSVSKQIQHYLMKRRGSVEIRPFSMVNGPDDEHFRQLDSLYVDFEKFIETLVTPFKLSFDGRLLELALHVAHTCVVEANHRAEFGFGRAFPYGHFNPHYLVRAKNNNFDDKPAQSWLLNALWKNGTLLLEDFMSMSYASSEAGDPPSYAHHSDVIALSNRGHVIFPKALLDFSTDLRDVLALIVIPGNLEWRGSKYKLLKEKRPPRVFGPLNQKNPAYYDFFSSDNKFVRPQTVYRGHYEVRMQVALGSTVLFLRAEIVNISNGAKVQCSIYEAQGNLCEALRPRRSNRSLATLEEELRLRPILVLQKGPTDLLGPQDHYYRRFMRNDPVQYPDARSIGTHTGDPAVDFLRAGAAGRYCPMVLQGDASILECIKLAEETFGNYWTILAEPYN